MSDVWEKLMNDPTYKSLLEQLPDDEKILVLKSLKELVDLFEKGLIEPFKKINKE